MSNSLSIYPALFQESRRVFKFIDLSFTANCLSFERFIILSFNSIQIVPVRASVENLQYRKLCRVLADVEFNIIVIIPLVSSSLILSLENVKNITNVEELLINTYLVMFLFVLIN